MPLFRRRGTKNPGYHAQVDEILSYINTHISENLTLEELSAISF